MAGPFTEEEIQGFTETASGLKYKEVEAGDGATPQKGQTVTAQYAGRDACAMRMHVYVSRSVCCACVGICIYVHSSSALHSTHMHACVHTCMRWLNS
jgi:hypothetical protein